MYKIVHCTKYSTCTFMHERTHFYFNSVLSTDIVGCLLSDIDKTRLLCRPQVELLMRQMDSLVSYFKEAFLRERHVSQIGCAYPICCCDLCDQIIYMDGLMIFIYTSYSKVGKVP
jgi:hypothetical protein